MLYSDHKNFVFVHVWKTAGESIVDSLRGYCAPYFRSRILNKILRDGPEALAALGGWRAQLAHGQHLHAQDIRKIMPEGCYDACYSFGFVRNPWDWTVSAYHYARQTPANPEHEIAGSFTSLGDDLRYRAEHYPRQQSSFLVDENDRQMVDKIGRFETLEDDFAEIARAIGVEVSLPKRNVSRRKRDWRSYYDDESYDLVTKIYRKDIELLGYPA